MYLHFLCLALTFVTAFVALESYGELCEDFEIISLPISIDGNEITRISVNYSQLHVLLTEGLSIDGDITVQDKDKIRSAIEDRLRSMKISSHVDSRAGYKSFLQSEMVNIVNGAMGTDASVYQDQMFLSSSRQRNPGLENSELGLWSHFLLQRRHPVRLLPPFANPSVIRIYQTPDAYTGGTTAMRTLHHTLVVLGYNSVLCNSSNLHSEMCSSPTVKDIVVTGEWCEPVLSEYLQASQYVNNTPSRFDSFMGRGVQYFLGFHHGRDFCRGWVPVADSHFIHTTLLHSGVSAYYLGCVMAEHIEEAYLRSLQRAAMNEDCEDIPKERLLLLDADWLDDYPNRQQIQFDLPEGYEVIILRGLPKETVLFLLKRATLVLDLAMPGPERISSEAVLFGAIPIISERWNGASEVDFPGVLRVDPLNGSHISSVLSFAAKNYESLLQQQTHSFHAYVASMWTKSANTVNAYFSSSSLHFLIDGRSSLQKETEAIFQAISLLHLFPLASLDIVVSDVMWFVRHHYVFVDLLRQSGYLRADPMDPRDFARADESRVSFVRIIHAMDEDLAGADRPWSAFKIALRPGRVFRHPHDAFHLLHLLSGPADKQRCSFQNNADDAVVIVAGPDVSVLESWRLSQSMATESSADCSFLHKIVAVGAVCDLLHETDSSNESANVVSGVRDSLIWKMMATVFRDQLRRGPCSND